MKTKARIYFNAVGLAGFLTLAFVYPQFIGEARALPDIVGVLMLVGIAWLSELLAFTFGNDVKFATSIAELPFLACIVLFPPAIAVPAIALTVFVSKLYPQRLSARFIMFNTSQAMLAAASAGLLYHWLAPEGPAGPERTSAPALIAFGVAVIVFSLVNMGLVAGALALIREQKFRLVMGEVVGANGSNIKHGMLSSPIALMIVLLYDKFEVAGIMLVLLPLLLVRYSFANNVALNKANKDLLRVLIKAIETRDPYTSGHSLRVATLAVAIAEDLGLSRQQIEDVEYAALLHDVGKIDPTFSSVIRKPYDLSPEERALIQTHAALGADLLQNLKSVKTVIVDAVRHHHERMDGKGYPAGLTGMDIPLAARIIMLCDSIDAMLSDRPYRKALPLDRVRQELVRCSGDQFDPEIVKVILQKDTLTQATKLVDTVSGFEDEYLIRAHA